MHLTFDHNILVALENNEPSVHYLKSLIRFHNQRDIEIRIPAITALENPKELTAVPR